MNETSDKGTKTSRQGDAICALVILAWVGIYLWRMSHIGLYFDDYLSFRHYSPVDLVRSLWTNLAIVTDPGLWVPAYRPGTLWSHAITYEVFGFKPQGLLLARVIVVAMIGILWYAQCRVMGLGRLASVVGPLFYTSLPVNSFALNWNTEIGALSALVWMFASFICLTRFLREGLSKSWFIASVVLWCLALLTKELMLPATIGFAVLLCGYLRPLSVRNWTYRLLPYALVCLVYLVVRSIVLEGKWGGQGFSPDRGDFPLSVYVRNYWLYLTDVIPGVSPRAGVQLSQTSMLVTVIPFVLGVIATLQAVFVRIGAIGSMQMDTLSGGPSQGPTEDERAVAQFDHLTTLLLLGIAICLGSGLVVMFFPEIREMYVGTVGIAILWGGGIAWLGTQPRWSKTMGGRVALAGVLVASLGMQLRVSEAMVFRPESDFVRRKELEDLGSYFGSDSLYGKCECFDQAKYLHDDLAAKGLLTPSGEANQESIAVLLRKRGVDESWIRTTLKMTAGRKGALFHASSTRQR